MTVYGTYHGHDAASPDQMGAAASASDGPNIHHSSQLVQIAEQSINWESTFWVPLFFSLIAGLSTAIGALVVYAIGKSPTPAHMSFSLALAAGVMITVSVLEFWIPALVGGQNFWVFCIATVAGGLCFLAIEKFMPEEQFETTLDNTESVALQPSKTATAERSLDEQQMESSLKGEPPKSGKFRLALLMMLVLTAHNFPEGLAVAISTVENQHTGLLICFAIAVHNIPEGIAIAVPYFDADGDRRKAVLMALLSGLTEPLGALVALLVLKPILSHDVIETILIFVGGIMVCVAIFELIPASLKYKEMGWHFGGLFTGVGIMCGAHLIADV